jgi:hypothetical protein
VQAGPTACHEVVGDVLVRACRNALPRGITVRHCHEVLEADEELNSAALFGGFRRVGRLIVDVEVGGGWVSGWGEIAIPAGSDSQPGGAWSFDLGVLSGSERLACLVLFWRRKLADREMEGENAHTDHAKHRVWISNRNGNGFRSADFFVSTLLQPVSCPLVGCSSVQPVVVVQCVEDETND